MSFIEIPLIKARQSEWDMYVGVISAKDLYYIAEVDRIRLESLKVPKYAGYQRALAEHRVNSIRDYLNTPDSTFPNSIIMSIDSEYISTWKGVDLPNNKFSLLKIKKEKGAIKIIDGQHRCAALDSAKEDFYTIVTIFVDLDIIKCAQIFSKINSTQKSVNPSIAFQLFGYAENRSPQKTAHDIAEALNETKGSPFYRKLLMLGTKDEWSKGTLSQSTFCKHLMRLYTKNPESDENSLLREQKLTMYENYPLRETFIKGEDNRILEILWKFFYHIAKTWEGQWNDATGPSILVKTTGYIAFIEVMKKWLLGPNKKQVLNDEGVEEAFARIKATYENNEKKFVRTLYPSGQQGVQLLRDSLINDLNLNL